MLIDYYRAEYARHGHDPRYAHLGPGSGGLLIAGTRQHPYGSRPAFAGGQAPQPG